MVQKTKVLASNMKYLCYDIETCINKSTLNRVLYPGLGLNDEEAYQKHLSELALEDRDFVNPSFHQPISIAAIAIDDTFSILRIGLLGGEKRSSRSIVEHFWQTYNSKRPVLIDFNGKGFDMRVLELWAFQLGLTLNKHYFQQYGPRYRFSGEHIDLQDFLTNHGSVRFRGGLNLFAKLLGKPGKMETEGHMVQGLYEKGEIFKIEDYCLSDAMDTYFVFLRTRVMTGELTLSKERELVNAARGHMQALLEKEGYFKGYMENFGEWIPMDAPVT